MKKQVAVISILFLLLLSLCSCGSEGKATIQTKDGITENVSIANLKELLSGNRSKFEKLYGHAKITFIGTIESVFIDPYSSYSEGFDYITFKNGLTVFLLHDFDYGVDLEMLSPGARLRITTIMAESPRGGEDGISLNDNSGFKSSNVDVEEIKLTTITVLN